MRASSTRLSRFFHVRYKYSSTFPVACRAGGARPPPRPRRLRPRPPPRRAVGLLTPRLVPRLLHRLPDVREELVVRLRAEVQAVVAEEPRPEVLPARVAGFEESGVDVHEREVRRRRAVRRHERVCGVELAPHRSLLRRAVDGDEEDLDGISSGPESRAHRAVEAREVVADALGGDAPVEVVGPAVIHDHARAVREDDRLEDGVVEEIVRLGPAKGSVEDGEGREIGVEVARLAPLAEDARAHEQDPAEGRGSALSRRTKRRISPSNHSPRGSYEMGAREEEPIATGREGRRTETPTRVAEAR